MSLPDELLDELLSAHLDDALSGDERARVEQMLQNDPQVKHRLEQLSLQRESVREAAFDVPKLPRDFAQTVVRAAIERAESEELNADHPLRLAAVDSYVSRQDDHSWSRPRLVATIAGLAASILFVGLIVKQFGGDAGQTQLAESDTENTETIHAGNLVPGTSVASTEDLIDATVESVDALVADGASQNNLASESVDPSGQPGQAGEPSPASEPRLATDGGIDPVMDGAPMLADASSSNTAGGANTSDVGTAADKSTALPLVEPPASIRPLQMLMVIEIKQSSPVDGLGAFDRALNTVGIEVGSDRQVGEALAKAVTTDLSDSSVGIGEARVVLLESPMKKLDKLVSQLLTEGSGIEALSFSAISAETDAPLMRSIETVRTLDPTKVRHEGQGFPITAEGEALHSAWVAQVGDRSFVPMNGPQSAGMVSAMASSSSQEQGPNPVANILFLIR